MNIRSKITLALCALALATRRATAPAVPGLAHYPAPERARFAELLAAFAGAGYRVIITSTTRPAVPGEPSLHARARALDLNVIGPDGTHYRQATPRAAWLATGLPALARSLGFRWGGDFTTPYRHAGQWRPGYDPVHFDLGSA